MMFVIDFYEVQGTEKVYRFTKEMIFKDFESCKYWILEFLQTSNSWKNCNMIAKISVKTKITIHYNGKQ